MPSNKKNGNRNRNRNRNRKGKQPSCQSAGGGNNLPPVSATTHEQDTLLPQRQKDYRDENPQIMDPIEKERRLDENTRQIELLIAIKKAIIERENKKSPEENCDAETLKEYTILANYYLLDPKTMTNYEPEKQLLQCLETIILEHTDELGITDSEQEPYIDDYNIRVAEHKIRIEEALNKLQDKTQADSEETLNLQDRLTKLLENNIFEKGKSPETVRQLVGLEKKLNNTFTAFKPINDTITALELQLQLQLQLQHKFSPVKESQLTNSPKETGDSKSPTGVQDLCVYLDKMGPASPLADTANPNDQGTPPDPEKRKAPKRDGNSSPQNMTRPGIFTVPTHHGSLMELAKIGGQGYNL